MQHDNGFVPAWWNFLLMLLLWWIVQEVVTCVKDELATASMSSFVTECLSLTVERSSAARHHTGAMLRHLLRQRLLTMPHYVDGLHDFLTVADDMVTTS